MTTRAMMAVAAFGGLLTALAVTPSADALPLSKSQQASPQGLVTQVAPGGRGRGGGGFSGRSGGISRGFRGPGSGISRGFRGPGSGISRGFRGPGRGSFNSGPRGPRAHHHGPRGGRHHYRGPRFRGYGFATPFVGYGAYYYGGYGDDCSWLRRRALATGSAYWWDRYYACIED
ncbi:MAG: hypothetical protein Q8K85_03905 [Hyphomicrobium sp.]|nr:hypothetical protein [Hyphomicrobium sp.]